METVVKLDQVTFAYPADTGEPSTPVLSGASAELPAGLVSFVGQNGYGKSTLLLLAGARLIPDEGSVTVLGTSTRSFQGAREDAEIEEERNRLVSFVYQNMEFESSESVGDLMEFVYKNGFHDDKSLDLLQSIRKELQLDPFLGKRTQDLAKGQLQRAIIGFSLLYGSRIIMMDEPVFALEEPQKDRAFEFLKAHSEQRGVPIYFSVHNLDLSRKYASHSVLFTKKGKFEVGDTETVLSRERLERAYDAPLDTLHERDKLYRQILIQDHQG